jgi:hypothetical protein
MESSDKFLNFFFHVLLFSAVLSTFRSGIRLTQCQINVKLNMPQLKSSKYKRPPYTEKKIYPREYMVPGSNKWQILSVSYRITTDEHCHTLDLWYNVTYSDWYRVDNFSDKASGLYLGETKFQSRDLVCRISECIQALPGTINKSRYLSQRPPLLRQFSHYFGAK